MQVLKRTEPDHVFQGEQVEGLIIDQHYAALGTTHKNGGNLFLIRNRLLTVLVV
jgi:hypothetical protein